MKNGAIMAIVAVTMLASSCRKETVTETVPGIEPVNPRQVIFSLYTNKDFSNENGMIQFTVTIRNATKTIWDSTMAPMKIKDIPALANKFVIEKTILGNETSQLSVGFIYYIENVGMSWYFEKFEAGQVVKAVDYNFQ